MFLIQDGGAVAATADPYAVVVAAVTMCVVAFLRKNGPSKLRDMNPKLLAWGSGMALTWLCGRFGIAMEDLAASGIAINGAVAALLSQVGYRFGGSDVLSRAGL